ncbi:hypothetical protein OIK40_09365 [Erythrobacter sp. sf7]|uniref:Uncharacterized protein n=1 Tax=Erythrobacter fulvus TaxID=2987523 RepID=A0ABT5JPZ7_9SPHN|nr:hypothetical protein [Erythrobacter fulvus]MDC8754847.1 hypothetical protein [Erythrobacter fulvus]
MDNTTTDRAHLVVDTTGSDFEPTSYDIAPEDRELAERLAQFDPLAVPSPVKLTGGGAFNAPERFSVSILPPDKRGGIEAQLARVPADQRAQREHELVLEALKANSVNIRIKAGAGEGASPVERERLLIAREVYDLENEETSIYAQLAEVHRWVPVFDENGARVIDPNTGQQKVQAVEVVQGDRRKAMEARVADIRRQIELLDGFEGDRRLQRALKVTVEAEKARQQQLEEGQEARRRADEINRDMRVEAKAQTYAKHRRSAL